MVFIKKLLFQNGALDKKGTIGVDKCELIYSKYPDINLEWLITGEGEMLKSEVKPSKKLPDNKGVPLIPVEAMAGWGQGDVVVMDYETETYKIPEFDKLKVDL